MSNWVRCCNVGIIPQWSHPEYNNSSRDGPSASSPNVLVPALLLSCKQICEDPVPMVYDQPLCFEDGCPLYGFLVALSPTTRSEVPARGGYIWSLAKSA